MPPRLRDRDFQLLERHRLEAELRHVEHQLVFVEQTHDDLFAEQRRQTRDAEVDLFGLPVVGEADLDASVLREPLLGDVELRHDLQPRRDRVAELHRRRHDVVQDAVDAEAHAEFLLVRLDVNVARTLLNRRHQHEVHQPDDWRFTALLFERGDVDLVQLLEHLDVVVDDGRRFLERLGDHVERRGARQRSPPPLAVVLSRAAAGRAGAA